jgi:hypothetical protein
MVIFKNANSNDQLTAQAATYAVNTAAQKLSTSVLEKGASQMSASQLASATKTANNLKGAQVAAQVGQVVGDIAVGILQNKTQKDYNAAKIAVMKEDSRLQSLNTEQRLQLDEKIAKAVNDVAKLRIYEETLSSVGVGGIDSVASLYREKIKNESIAKTRGYFIIGGIAALIFAGALYIYKKKN